jgi:hypothetical protein
VSQLALTPKLFVIDSGVPELEGWSPVDDAKAFRKLSVIVVAVVGFLGFPTIASKTETQPGFLPRLSAASAAGDGGTAGAVPADGSTMGQNVRCDAIGSNVDDLVASSPLPCFAAPDNDGDKMAEGGGGVGGAEEAHSGAPD